MWKKTESEEPQLTPQPPAPVRSTAAPEPVREKAMIGKTIIIKGDLKGEEDLLIEGQVEGKIELKQHNITVGKNGRVKADIYAKVITIEGEVHGNLFGEHQLVLRQSSTVRGNIIAPRVALEDGCNFKGSIDMSPKETAHSGVTPAASTMVGTQSIGQERTVDKPSESAVEAGGLKFGRTAVKP